MMVVEVCHKPNKAAGQYLCKDIRMLQPTSAKTQSRITLLSYLFVLWILTDLLVSIAREEHVGCLEALGCARVLHQLHAALVLVGHIVAATAVAVAVAVVAIAGGLPETTS
jgi:hypothetical protein